MQAAAQVQQQLVEAGRMMMLGTTSVLTLFIVLGAGVYVCLCIRSCRQWNALEQRWAAPTQEPRQQTR